MPTYTVRQAAIQDVENLSEVFDFYRIFYEQSSDVIGAKAFLQERMDRQESTIIIVIEESTNRIVGFAQLYPVFTSIGMKRSLILNDLYIVNEHRRQGLAGRLLDAVYACGVELGVQGIELSTACTNYEAQSLYKQHGYVKDTKYEHYYVQC
ncbi:ribosomal protein S18 acetylase RimI-like enzyme [Paenibacillus shirakamiensis]|uniref:Ribosomal protein S18 acetylase RimI-like enzyme n=1 Tax=Paenibacillus shirakamiensis TaxID=1265935 RepID=A0ABS4JG41_9BACL|nr:GNAT family N-acetyltransferase [Paenibacillus shirakamiensis]MBP2000682.1 ribosomal protein S18 acetylase RimI-like enzyme [Paenibacillus shirakamiensis]